MNMEVGTLTEIGAQVGDVVEFVEGAEGFKDYTKVYGGFKYTVGEYGPKSDIPGAGGGWSDLCEHKFRIVSRASDYDPSPEELRDAAAAKDVEWPERSPVRTRTVTEIVPGVYGKVSVLRSNGWHFALTEADDKIAHVQLSTSELRAAIATLTQIADAMESGV